MQSVVPIKLEASPQLETSIPFAKIWWKVPWRSTSFHQTCGVILWRSLQQESVHLIRCSSRPAKPTRSFVVFSMAMMATAAPKKWGISFSSMGNIIYLGSFIGEKTWQKLGSHCGNLLFSCFIWSVWLVLMEAQRHIHMHAHTKQLC